MDWKIFLKTFGWPMPACRQAGLRYRGADGGGAGRGGVTPKIR